MLKVESKPTHVVFELVEVQPTNRVELVVWGPYPTTIGSIIGETVGVVRDDEFAVGIQALNAKTLGGYPASENDIEPDYGADDPGGYPNLPAELNKGQAFRGDAARRTDFGSVVQAFCRNRDRERIIANWGHEKFVAPAFSRRRRRRQQDCPLRLPGGQGARDDWRHRTGRGSAPPDAGWRLGQAWPPTPTAPT